MALRPRRKSIESKSDGDLLQAYRLSGKLEILGVLYSRYMPLVYGLCLKYFKNREMSRDAVMDIFEKLITELGRHKVDNFRSWLYVLSKNHCLMQLRKPGKDIGISLDMEENEYLFMENDPGLHHPGVGDDESMKLLEYCIDKLKKEHRECIRLFYYDNKCYREIADLMNIEEKKVKSHLQNAKRKLKICMEGNNEKE
ncbi:MAG: sigma-70 family RNA polymerase sigma factor [Bacteroidales bacterium]|jgi:RNA polymerase sigma-70 factor (ECF subfamily)|nr:sigma-70 family RNA polymerase sigma factor [Bacteroidales bacterium]